MAADFFEKIRVPPNCEISGILTAAATRMRERGATFQRASHHLGGILVFEGWKERPDDQGPQPDPETIPFHE